MRANWSPTGLAGSAAILLALMCAACGGAPDRTAQPGSSGAGAQDSADWTPVAPLPVMGRSVPDTHPALGFTSLSDLASPSEMLRRLGGARGTSFTPAEGHKDGAEYANLLPNNLVSVGGTALSFSPNFGPGAHFTDLAYAIWDFNLPSHPSGLIANFNWGLEPALANAYYGLGNFAADKWDWYFGTELPTLTINAASSYFDPGDRLLLVVALTGTDGASLTEIQLAGVEPPMADLTADVNAGLVPLDVDFDGSGSSDPDGSIVSYEWDFDGDGNFGEAGAEAVNADNPDPAPVTYSSAGSFDATLRVTDDDGASAQAVVTVTTNIAPTVQIGADVTVGNQPLIVTFTADAADTNGSITALEWDFDGDGSFNEAGAEQAANGDSTPLPYTYNAPGSFDATVRVLDNQGAPASDSMNIQVGSPPQVDLNADITSGPKPLTVTFSADASDPGGSIDDVEWDYDGDSVYNEPGNGELAAKGDLTPTPHTYTLKAERDAHVRVTDNDGGTATDSLHISITNTPPAADLQASPGTEGTAPFDVFFDASGSTDPGGTIANYEWDFDGDGIYNEGATEEATSEGNPTPDGITYFAGVTPVHLRVTDDDGATDVATVDITGHGWVIVTVDEQLGSEEGYSVNLMLQDGLPLIAHCTLNPYGLRLARSSTAEGASAADWTGGQALDGTFKPTHASLALVGGNPAVSFFADTGSNGLYYSRATNAAGMSTGDWITPVAVDLTDTAGLSSKLLEVSGKPSIGYNAVSVGDLRYARSTQDDGSSGWSSLLVDGDGAGAENFGGHMCMAIVSGCPAMAYSSTTAAPAIGLLYVKSSTASGAALADWTGGIHTTIYSDSSNDQYPSLAIVNGFPAVSYMDASNVLRFARSSSATGSAAWTSCIVDNSGITGEHSSLAVIGGFPAIAYHSQTSDRARYVSSSDANGNGAGTWTNEADIVGSGSNGRFTTLLELPSGRAACAFRDDGNALLKYGVLY